MTFKINPLTKIIALSSVLATGFLLVVLAGAIYGNWFPVLIAFIYGIAHLPVLITGFYGYQYEDYLNDSPTGKSTDILDFGRFLSSFLLCTATMFPLILYHCHVLTHVAAVLTIIGGFLIYGTVLTFTTFFDSFGGEDEDPFNF